MLAFFIRFPLIPAAPFLKADVSDIPIFAATLLLGPECGLSILFCVCSLRTILFSSAGLVGFIVRMTSIVNILCLGYLYKHKNWNLLNMSLNVLVGLILCLVIKIPLNYIFWLYFWGIPKISLDTFIFTVIIPFNALKIIVNSLLGIYTANILKKFVGRNPFTYH